MKTITETKILISSFKELLTLGKGHQLTAQEIINGRTYINGNWETVSFADDFLDQILPLIAECLGGQNKTKRMVLNSLKWSRPQHWGLQRVFFREYNYSMVPMPDKLKRHRVAVLP